MHAAGVADVLDVPEVVVPRASGVLSAYGLVASDERHEATRTLASDADAEEVLVELEEEVLSRVDDRDAAQVQRYADARYKGQGFELRVEADEPFDGDEVARRFHAEHEREYGYRMDVEVEVVGVRAVATVAGDAVEVEDSGGRGDSMVGEREVVFPGQGGLEADVHDRGALGAGDRLSSAVVEGRESTVVVPPDWTVEVEGSGDLRMRRDGG